MRFFGREAEQKAINAILEKDDYQGCLIYGRRRMGKTELIKRCLLDKGVPTLVFQCKDSSEKDNASALSKLIMRELGLKYLNFEGFMAAIDFLFEFSKQNDLYFVLDEYPYLRGLIDGCDSKLQEIIDKHAMTAKIKFFLLGSSISAMTEIQNQSSPLHMRFANSILLKQMDYYDASKFYPSLNDEDKVRMYAAFGGVPFYNAQIDERLSVKENTINVISGQFSGLKDFLDIYLKSELRKINSANAVFEAIALGAFHFNDILSKSHLDSSPSLASILQKLISMDLIDYVYPINDPKNKQKAGYRISDFCVRFYYSYIYRNESAHSILDDSTFYDLFIEKEFETKMVPSIFEEVTRQYLIRENKKGKINPPLLNIGTFWYDNPKEKKNGQFDVVGLKQDGYVFFECKFSKNPIDGKTIKKELEQISKTSFKPIQYGFVSRSGFSLKEGHPYWLISLADLYK